MGFGFVKFIVNPEPSMSGSHLDDSKQWYLRQLVDLVVDESMPVVVCIHPERELKKNILSSPDERDTYRNDTRSAALRSGQEPDAGRKIGASVR